MAWSCVKTVVELCFPNLPEPMKSFFQRGPFFLPCMFFRVLFFLNESGSVFFLLGCFFVSRVAFFFQPSQVFFSRVAFFFSQVRFFFSRVVFFFTVEVCFQRSLSDPPPPDPPPLEPPNISLFFFSTKFFVNYFFLTVRSWNLGVFFFFLRPWWLLGLPGLAQDDSGEKEKSPFLSRFAAPTLSPFTLLVPPHFLATTLRAPTLPATTLQSQLFLGLAPFPLGRPPSGPPTLQALHPHHARGFV